MSAQGWSVLNYALLGHPEVTKAMTLDDLKAECAEVFGKFYGQDLPCEDDLKIQLAKCQSPTSATTTGRTVSSRG